MTMPEPKVWLDELVLDECRHCGCQVETDDPDLAMWWHTKTQWAHCANPDPDGPRAKVATPINQWGD